MTSQPSGQQNNEWIDAIHDDRLSDLDEPIARAACEAIGHRMATEIAAIVEILNNAGVALTEVPAIEDRMQRHAAELHVANADGAHRAAERLIADGFTVWEPTTRGAGRVHARCHSVLTLARTTDVTIAVRLRWPSAARRIPGSLVPNQADFAAVDLPGALWPLYFAVRPLRLAAERVGARTPAPAVLGPFLSTPSDVIPALLDLGNVTASDTVADLGCGDGRILIEAAQRTGCKAIGIESDAALAAEAQQRAKAAGVSDRVRIINGDATAAELGQATTVFVFLPADATVSLVDQLRSSLEAGTRLIAHEQHRLPRQIDGATSTALIRGQGITVAHQWIVGR